MSTKFGGVAPTEAQKEQFAEDLSLATKTDLASKVNSVSPEISGSLRIGGDAGLEGQFVKSLGVDMTPVWDYPPVPPPSGVNSFNNRTGAVSLSDTDVTSALGYTPEDSTASKVSSFNNRTGAVTLSGTDVNTALGYTAADAAVVGDINAALIAING